MPYVGKKESYDSVCARRPGAEHDARDVLVAVFQE